MDIHPDYADTAAQQGQDSPGWWPLNCLRSLGRAASVAAGNTRPQMESLSLRQHADYRGFSILTTGQDGAYCARITHRDGESIRIGRQLQRYIDAARFDSPEEAAQHARFVIASGALNHPAADAAQGGHSG